MLLRQIIIYLLTCKNSSPGTSQLPSFAGILGLELETTYVYLETVSILMKGRY